MGRLATEQHRNQVLSNISLDTRLNDAEKALCDASAEMQFQQLSADPNSSDRDAVTDIWDACCSSNLPTLSAAPIIPTGAGLVFGNIWSIRSFQNAVAFQYPCDPAEAKRLVSLACKHPSVRSRDEEADVVALRSRVTLRSIPVWLFQGSVNPADPFAGVNFGTLPCQLGLPYRASEEYAAFRISPPSGTRMPCVLDADWFFQQYWRPGGSSRPFCESGATPGFSEWIAEPPMLADTEPFITVHVAVEGMPVTAMPYDV